MGILNLTPDSFYDGGRYVDFGGAVARAVQMEEEGADLIDVGAESTRPGAEEISDDEELERLFPILGEILSRVKVPVSLDTTKSKVAMCGLQAGVSIINDVSGLHCDPQIANLARKYEAGLILMHRRGSSKTMQELARYSDLMAEVMSELKESVTLALDAGVSEHQIAIDPGLGFSKTAEHNFEIIRNLNQFRNLSRPIVVGASRKSFLGAVTGRKPEERVYSSAVIAALLVERGANILRVHDVAATHDAVSVALEVAK